MNIDYPIRFGKTQTKMMDCWYACIQMVKSARANAKTKPTGDTTMAHRSMPVIGQKLSFASDEGDAIMHENDLTPIERSIKFNNIVSVYNTLQQYGPFIVGGKFALFNTQGHFIVISGCNTVTGKVTIYDPGWGGGRSVKSWTYITKHVWKAIGDDDSPAACSFIGNLF